MWVAVAMDKINHAGSDKVESSALGNGIVLFMMVGRRAHKPQLCPRPSYTTQAKVGGKPTFRQTS